MSHFVPHFVPHSELCASCASNWGTFQWLSKKTRLSMTVMWWHHTFWKYKIWHHKVWCHFLTKTLINTCMTPHFQTYTVWHHKSVVSQSFTFLDDNQLLGTLHPSRHIIEIIIFEIHISSMWTKNGPHVDHFESMWTKWTKMVHISVIFNSLHIWLLL